MYKLGDSGLFLTRDDSNNSNNITSNFDRFFDYWRELIESRERVSEFELIGDSIHFTVTVFNCDGYLDVKGTFKLESSLLSNTNFMLFLNVLIIRFKSKKSESLSTIENKKSDYFKPEVLASLAKVHAEYFSKNESIEIDSELKKAIGVYVKNNISHIPTTDIQINSLKYFPIALILTIAGIIVSELSGIFGGTFHNLGYISIGGAVLFSGINQCFILNAKMKKLSMFAEAYISEEKEKNSEEKEPRIRLAEVKDKMYDFVLEDIHYMREIDSASFYSICKRFDRFISEFGIYKTNEVCRGLELPKFICLDKLAVLEIDMYNISRGDCVGFINKDEVYFGKDKFFDRLSYLGIDREEVESDENIKSLFSVLDRVLSLPYIGCEKDIIKLLRIVQQYYESGKQICSAELLNRLQPVEKDISDMINWAFDSEPGCITPSKENDLEHQNEKNF